VPGTMVATAVDALPTPQQAASAVTAADLALDTRVPAIRTALPITPATAKPQDGPPAARPRAPGASAARKEKP